MVCRQIKSSKTTSTFLHFCMARRERKRERESYGMHAWRFYVNGGAGIIRADAWGAKFALKRRVFVGGGTTRTGAGWFLSEPVGSDG